MDDIPGKLDLISDEELIDEIISRFDHAVFGGIKEIHEDDDEITREWAGKEFTCKGIAIGIIEKINEDMNGVEE